MAAEWPAWLRQVLRGLVVACVPALAFGYAIFYSVYPSATFPVSGDASFLWIFIVALVGTIIGGMQAKGLAEAIIAEFVALLLGYVIAVLLALSPAFAGLYLLAPSGVPFFVARYSLLVVALGIPIVLVGSIIGQIVQERIVHGRSSPGRLG
jgi:hypothetical protein